MSAQWFGVNALLRCIVGSFAKIIFLEYSPDIMPRQNAMLNAS
jgi:hypothetical protein